MLFQDQLSEVIRSFDSGTLDEARFLLTSLRPPEKANLLESTPPKMRRVLWELMDETEENQVLQYLSEDVLSEFLESMNTDQLVAAADMLETDDFADILQQLPSTISDQVLANMNLI